MRTTLQIDDDVLEVIRSLARAENKSLSRVATDLIRRGLEPRREAAANAEGFPVFDVPAGVQPLTLELVKLAEEDE